MPALGNIAASFGALFNNDEPSSITDILKRYVADQILQTYGSSISSTAAVAADRKQLKADRRSSLTAQLTSEERGRQRLGGQVSGNVAQAGGHMPANFGGALDNALRRTKMRTRLQGMGEAQVGQQGLKDRIAVASASRRREGELINAFGRRAQITQGVNFATADANQIMNENRMGAFGSLAGAGLSYLINNRGSTVITPPPGTPAPGPSSPGGYGI